LLAFVTESQNHKKTIANVKCSEMKQEPIVIRRNAPQWQVPWKVERWVLLTSCDGCTVFTTTAVWCKSQTGGRIYM